MGSLECSLRSFQYEDVRSSYQQMATRLLLLTTSGPWLTIRSPSKHINSFSWFLSSEPFSVSILPCFLPSFYLSSHYFLFLSDSLPPTFSISVFICIAGTWLSFIYIFFCWCLLLLHQYIYFPKINIPAK